MAKKKSPPARKTSGPILGTGTTRRAVVLESGLSAQLPPGDIIFGPSILTQENVTVSALSAGLWGYCSAALTFSKTDSAALATSRAAGVYYSAGTLQTAGPAASAFTTAGGSPSNGAPVYLANAADDSSTGAGKLTATAPTVGQSVQVGICIDNGGYAGSKTSVVLIQVQPAIVPSFSPSALSPVLWVSGDSGTWQNTGKTTPATANGDIVKAWSDRSGNGHDLVQATTGNAPLLAVPGLNGLPGVVFDGSNDIMQAAFTLPQPVYLALVGYWANPGVDFSRPCDGNTQDTLAWFTSATPWTTYQLYSGTAGVANQTYDTAANRLLELCASGAGSFSSIGGGADATGNPGTVAPGGLAIGGKPGPTVCVALHAFEVVMLNYIPTGIQRDRLRTYLATKWGF